MPRLTRSQISQIEQYLQVAINNYDAHLVGEHSAYVSTLLTHIQADFSQLLVEFPLDEPTEAQFHSSYPAIVAAVLRREDPFEQTIEERADAIVAALPLAEAQEITDLKLELKCAGKRYGQASQTIGFLRRELGRERLHRVCWARAQASDCSACRHVFADEPFYDQKAPSREEYAAAQIRKFYGDKPAPVPDGVHAIHSDEPADTPVIGSQLEVPGERDLDGLQRTRSRTRPARPNLNIHIAAFTPSGRDTGHALCGSSEGRVTVGGDATCVHCIRCFDTLEEP